jgi:hypothetical protein
VEFSGLASAISLAPIPRDELLPLVISWIGQGRSGRRVMRLVDPGAHLLALMETAISAIEAVGRTNGRCMKAV